MRKVLLCAAVLAACTQCAWSDEVIDDFNHGVIDDWHGDKDSRFADTLLAVSTDAPAEGGACLKITVQEPEGMAFAWKSFAAPRSWPVAGRLEFRIKTPHPDFYHGIRLNDGRDDALTLPFHAQITEKDAWTKVVIPLADFQKKGVNLREVSSLMIRLIPDRDAQWTDGEQLYLDDLRIVSGPGKGAARKVSQSQPAEAQSVWPEKKQPAPPGETFCFVLLADTISTWTNRTKPNISPRRSRKSTPFSPNRTLSSCWET
ncbi:MAG: hypothetical protein SVT52_05815 [Planctomycetota bacterium]|nr:hypothetical protein [Planctomycetota bacterium]